MFAFAFVWPHASMHLVGLQAPESIMNIYKFQTNYLPCRKSLRETIEIQAISADCTRWASLIIP